MKRLLLHGIGKHALALHAEQLPCVGALGAKHYIDEAAVRATLPRRGVREVFLWLFRQTDFHHVVPLRSRLGV